MPSNLNITSRHVQQSIFLPSRKSLLVYITLGLLFHILYTSKLLYSHSRTSVQDTSPFNGESLREQFHWSLFNKFPEVDLLELSYRQKKFGEFYNRSKTLFEAVKKSHRTQSAIHKYFETYFTISSSLGQLLYPWLPKLTENNPTTPTSPFHFHFVGHIQENMGDEAGVVVCVGNFYAKHAWWFIQHLRLLQCKLKIEVFYAGDDDLLPQFQQLFDSLPGVRTRDITRIFDQGLLRISGWSIKPFAILASSFRHVILVDADAVFLQNPENLLREPTYLQYGTLFFKDRSVFGNFAQTKHWVQDVILNPSDYIKSTRFWNLRTMHEMESGVVVIDKMRNIIPMLAVAKLNEETIRNKVTYQHLHGDKDTFWLAFEMVEHPYGFSPHAVGVISENENSKQNYGCSDQILHFNDRGPLWINGGILKNKRSDFRFAEFEFYFKEQPWNVSNPFAIQGLWFIEGPFFCLNSNDRHSLNEDELALLKDFKGLWVTIDAAFTERYR